jgi:hypothetical protein
MWAAARMAKYSVASTGMAAKSASRSQEPRANVEQQVRAILEGQAAVLANMARISKRLDSLEDKLSDQNRKN